ncbi:dihydrolipoamide acetyltransferase [Parafrankia colletiae]|uniref:Dihydrolipoamide acetyltransferase component of pyruvate dehydrogenase complex n=1 Tax=Parafrankia colletiae TaxID=573497 RepID=A0A1S1REQ1_9ACTN|nr:dihydrolipoamide acetyltransferase family protein [Parafrankia colletiae]MCK9904927.1 2-oxo acid dehydrogenase subunit E2 [Frankia sp. Cpl3]OHV44660.1 dihydrolipoamide acetyltransferase [Parafrankia colletiae]
MPEITMPRLSDTMEDGVVMLWRKQVGDKITSGEILVEVETDKAIMELEAYDDGVLERILVDEGSRVPIGTPIAVIGDGTGTASSPDSSGGPASDTAPGPASPASTTCGRTDTTGGTDGAGASADSAGDSRADRPRSSPLARKIAAERGVDLANIVGTGPGGRIVRADVEHVADTVPSNGIVLPEPVRPAPNGTPTARDAARSPAPEADVDELPLSGIQRVAAKRLTESKQQAPHFYLTRAVDITALTAFRTTLNETLAATGGPKLSINDLIVKAVATTIRTNPSVNVSFGGDVLRRHRRINLGIAVAVESGLVVPVITDADRRPVSEIATIGRELAERARAGRLQPADMSGGTFTISNLGMFGIEQFAAVINPPEAAILAVGAATQEVRIVDGEMVARAILRLTLSADHRAIDGATGARFLQDLARTLETPLRIVS